MKDAAARRVHEFKSGMYDKVVQQGSIWKWLSLRLQGEQGKP